jgi:hypothetical protein
VQRCEGQGSFRLDPSRAEYEDPCSFARSARSRDGFVEKYRLACAWLASQDQRRSVASLKTLDERA